MSENPFSYSLSEISKWQLDSDNSKVLLPPLQRGFVWKVNQIEALWDSILRGFPLGSFLLSTNANSELFLLDGQQRATSIALGFYNPWDLKEIKFWSLKNIPVAWIDLADLRKEERTDTQIFTIRVITQSHPWGYQRKNNKAILTVSDRKKALELFKKIPNNEGKKYIQFDLNNVYPYDTNLPVPLVFLIKSIQEDEANWKEKLVTLCKENLSVQHIQTKHSDFNDTDYIEQLVSTLSDLDFSNKIFNAVKNSELLEIPKILVKGEILKAEDEQTGDNPTLFVRLNSSGTRIEGEELIYSIYKASFPQAKELVEHIGTSFVVPSLVISLVSRLALSELNGGTYPSPISVNEFRKKIQENEFRNKLRELIGESQESSPAGAIFRSAFELLLSANNFRIPPVLVKQIVKGSPDLFLMLLQWVKLNEEKSGTNEKNILATITTLSWFGKDNKRFVREVWKNLGQKNFWNKEFVSQPFYQKNDFLVQPFVSPEELRNYLMQDVVEMNVDWNQLYPKEGNRLMIHYKTVIGDINFSEEDKETRIKTAINSMWENFINRLFWNKSLVLFAQREYINERFGEFNQMENLEDTNTPWDWDHIYPESWVYWKPNISPLTRKWNSCIGNFRAMSLEENRSENNNYSPQARLYNKQENIDVREQSFIKENDWKYWDQITGKINEGDAEMVNIHLSAIINRLCNIYQDWYSTLDLQEIFNK